MGKMKANRKFREADERAVSAVIGVILMVAITVAIAATVYVYVSGMIGGGSKRTPNIACVPNNTDNVLQVTSSDPDVAWADVNITIIPNGTGTPIYRTLTGTVTAGQTIDCSPYLVATGNKCAVTLRYNPTNSLIGTWTVS
jgi:archaeal type IV pilus assembly protein PilA